MSLRYFFYIYYNIINIKDCYKMIVFTGVYICANTFIDDKFKKWKNHNDNANKLYHMWKKPNCLDKLFV